MMKIIKTYYDMFDKTNSVINKGELNYFINNFLSFIKEGQESLIEELKQKFTIRVRLQKLTTILN